MRLVYGLSDEIAQFVQSRIPEAAGGFGECQAIGVSTDDNRIVAGVVYHAWNPVALTLHMSAAAEDRRWLQRTIVTGLFDYPFGELGCQMVIGETRADSSRVIDMWRAFGADQHMIPRLFGRNVDGALMRLTVEAFRASRFYVGDDHGQEIRPEAA